MRAQLIVDCGCRVLSALIVTPDGRLLPCSQQVRQSALRHVPSEIAFDRRATEHGGFVWDDVPEILSKAQPHQFFARARRIGLRRPWDHDLATDALRLASPIGVLSSAAALADPAVEALLPAAGVAMLDALLDPIFAFVAERKLAAAEIDAVAVLPAHAGRHARVALRKVFRRRGFVRLTILSREIAAAMALVDTAATECVVWDVSDHGLHVHRVSMDGGRFTTVASATLRALSWNEWVQRIAAAMRENADGTVPTLPALGRAVTAFLTGAPHDAPLTHAVLQRAGRDDGEIASRLQEALEEVGGSALPAIAIAEICGIDAVRRLFPDQCTPPDDVPVLDRVVHGVAAAALWLRGDASRRVVVQPSGSLRINTLRGETVEILGNAQLPPPGDHCHVRTKLAFRGATDSASPFLVHLLWGTDTLPEGNATLCALRFDRGHARGGDGALRLAVHTRRSRNGHCLNGIVDVGGGAVRAGFTQEFPAWRSS